MSRLWRHWMLPLIGVAAVALAAPAAAPAASHSGTVMAVDQQAGTIVLAEVGPWRVKSGETEITPQTIVVTASTEFTRIARAAGAGPGGWAGEFVEAPSAAWQVKKGDFVTVSVTRDKQGLTALKVAVVEPSER